MDSTEVVPGYGSLLAVAGGVLCALLSPVYAVLDFADDKDPVAWCLVGLAVAGVAGAWSGVVLRRGGMLPQVVMLAFAVVAATAGIAIQVRHGTTKPAILLGALGVSLPLFMIAEKGWLSGVHPPSSEAPLSDG